MMMIKLPFAPLHPPPLLLMPVPKHRSFVIIIMIVIIIAIMIINDHPNLLANLPLLSADDFQFSLFGLLLVHHAAVIHVGIGHLE